MWMVPAAPLLSDPIIDIDINAISPTRTHVLTKIPSWHVFLLKFPTPNT